MILQKSKNIFPDKYCCSKNFEYILTDGPNENVKNILRPQETFSKGNLE
jgi:hypothetical protein